MLSEVFFGDLFSPVNLEFYAITVTRIFVAFILGGIVGYQKESSKKPVGLRTHILVCVGSALVMIISEYYRVYLGVTSGDPARLGAQVISGIGFLGAGTIMKEGATVKGLTTAAGIWVVACIGLTVGAGFFGGAIIVTILITIGLNLLKLYEDTIIKRSKRDSTIYVRAELVDNITGQIEEKLSGKGTIVKNIVLIEKSVKDLGLFRIRVKIPYNTVKKSLIEELKTLEEIKEIY